MSIKEFSVLVMICVIWGLHFIVIKVTVGETADPLFYAAVRMSLVSLVLFPFLKWHSGVMSLILIGGLGYGALNYAFMFPALGMTTASAAAVTIELYVPFSILLSMIVFGDRIGPLKTLGVILALAGVVIIGLSKPSEAAGPLFVTGIVLMAGAALSEAIGAISVKKVTGIGPFHLLAWFAVIGTVVLWPLSWFLEDGQTEAFNPENRLNFGLALLYSAGLVSIVAHASYYWLLQRLPIYVVASSGLITTVIAVIFSAILLGETLTLAQVFGGLTTLFGVTLILWRNTIKSADDIQPAP